MEKKSIGSFIAALRKAKGLTQKQLAEKLNVSDKSVSRWERDECAPDLSLIPVIAEVFDVTSDELLRGQRATPDVQPTKYEEQKTEKQIQYLLQSTLVQFQIRSTISIGIAIVGLIAAMICNFGFLRAYIGFGVSCIFYLCALVCQIIFTIIAFSALKMDELTNSGLDTLKGKLLNLTLWTGSSIMVLFTYTLPLMTEVWDAYAGLNADAWFTSGALAALICAVVCMFIGGITKGKLAKNDIIPQNHQQTAVNKLRMKWLTIACVACFITAGISQVILPGYISPSDFAKGISFDNWDDFKTCIESVEFYDGETIAGATILPEEDEYFYTGQDGYVYSNPLPMKDIIENEDGIVVEFYWLNESISEIEYGEPEDQYLPVTVYRTYDIRAGQYILETIQTIILLLMIPEIIVCILLYSKRKKQIINN